MTFQFANLHIAAETTLFTQTRPINMVPGDACLIISPQHEPLSQMLADILMGNDATYQLKAGHVTLFDRDLTPLTLELRARAGLFRLYAEGPPEDLKRLSDDYLRELTRLFQPIDFDLRQFNRKLCALKERLALSRMTAPSTQADRETIQRRAFEYLQWTLLDPPAVIIEKIDKSHALLLQEARARGRMILAFSADPTAADWFAPTTLIDGSLLWQRGPARDESRAPTPWKFGQESPVAARFTPHAATPACADAKQGLSPLLHHVGLRAARQGFTPGWLGQLRLEAAHRLESCASEDRQAREQIEEALNFLMPPATAAREPLDNGSSASSALSHAQTLWPEMARQGGYIGPLETALGGREASLIQRYLGTLTRESGRWQEWLNMVQWQTGHFVHIPPGAMPPFVIEAPRKAAASESLTALTRTLIIVDKGATVTFIEGCAAREQGVHRDGMRLATSELFIAAGASVDFVALNHFAGTMRDRSRKFIRLAAGAHLTLTEVIVDPADTLLPPIVQIEGAGTTFTYRQLVILSRGQSWVPLGVEMSRSSSTQRFEGRVIIQARLLADGGSSVCCNLLQRPLDLDAAADQGEWQAELKCMLWDECSTLRFGGQLPRDTTGFSLTPPADPAPQIAYLRSRGFSTHEARALISECLAADILAELPMEYAVEIQRLLSAMPE